MTEATRMQARFGDEVASRELTDAHRRELHVHWATITDQALTNRNQPQEVAG